MTGRGFGVPVSFCSASMHGTANATVPVVDDSIRTYLWKLEPISLRDMIYSIARVLEEVYRAQDLYGSVWEQCFPGRCVAHQCNACKAEFMEESVVAGND